jgi:hypothetical protein
MCSGWRDSVDIRGSMDGALAWGRWRVARCRFRGQEYWGLGWVMAELDWEVASDHNTRSLLDLFLCLF